MSENTTQTEAQNTAYTSAAPVKARVHSTKTTFKDTNTFAVVSVILAFIAPIAAIVFGHISLGQIKRNGDEGRGLALTGLIIGYVAVLFMVLAVLMCFAFLTILIASLGTGTDPLMGGGYNDFGFDTEW